jgi:hypothetical protein
MDGEGRTLAELWETLAQALDTFKPAECVNCFAAAGYGPD